MRLLLPLLFSVAATAQVQIAAVPKVQTVFQHLRLQAWTIRACNPDPVVRHMTEDEIFQAIPTVPFLPSTDAVAILQGKQQESMPAKIAKYLGWGSDVGGLLTTSGRVAASPQITAALVAAMVTIPAVRTYLQGEVPSIGTLTENLLAGKVDVPASDSRDAGCIHWTAYSSKFPKKTGPTTAVGSIK
jgi:hypothetical protein